jgi:hypothetical protein
MVNAQEWLDENYPNKLKTEEIDLSNLQFNEESKLTISNFPNLKRLGGEGERRNQKNKMTKITQIIINNCPRLEKLNVSLFASEELKINNCPSLKELYCYDNKLTNLDFLTGLIPKKLAAINIYNNNFSSSSLDIFQPFTNLEFLHIGTDDNENIEQGIYNRFFGSLEPLKDLIKLKSFYIANTDIDRGMEYLSEKVEEFYCSANMRKDAKCQVLEEKLTPHKGNV